MKKGLLLCCSLLTCSIAHAGNVYIAPSIYAEHVTGTYTSYNDLHPQIALGYVNIPTMKSMYLAGEVFVAPVYMNLSNQSDNNARSAKISYTIGASVLPGMLFTETSLVFMRFGVVDSKFSSPNQTAVGIQWGIGLQSTLINNWSLRGEYDYTGYKAVSGLGSPKSSKLGIGLIYQFV